MLPGLHYIQSIRYISPSPNLLYSMSICFFICRIKCVVLNAALLRPTHEMVVLQMLHVVAGLLSKKSGLGPC